MSDLSKAETVQTTDDKCEKESSTSIANNVNTSTPVRLFGQFKSSTTGFGQSSSNGQSSSTSLFTSTLSKLSSTNGSSGGFGSLSTNGSSGFGSSATSLAASLAPLSST